MPYGLVNASQVMFDGVMPPSGFPRPSSPWQFAHGTAAAGTSTDPPPIIAVISRSEVLSPLK
jgi:hypothetical protein